MSGRPASVAFRHLTTAPARAFIVADLGFGDSGKGLVTDYLTARHGAAAVLRWNGGAQAGHNVVTADGRHHCFAQFGAGTFHPGVLTLHTRDVVVHPTALRVEAEHLAAVGVPDALARLRLHAASRVITPFHQAVGRLRELARGDRRHGTCGIGFGETVADSLAAPERSLCVGDLVAGRASPGILERIRDAKRAVVAPWLARLAGMEAAAPELELLESSDVAGRWLELAREVIASVAVLDDDALAGLLPRVGPLVLEGAQGMLLDEWHGLHPHTTWSDCRMRAAATELARLRYTGEVTRVGVVRSYLTRHGQGPLPSRTDALDGLAEPHNSGASWQGAFRRGWQDLSLLRHAVAAGGTPDALVVTHLDALEALPALHVADGYALTDGRPIADLSELCGQDPERQRPEPEQLAAMQRVTDALAEARPLLTQVPGDGDERGRMLGERLRATVGARELWISHGPTAADVSPVAPYPPGGRFQYRD